MVKGLLGRWRIWVCLGVVLSIAGVLLVSLSVMDLSSRQVAHEQEVFGDGDPVVIGPYHLDRGNYDIWIEVYFEDKNNCDVYMGRAYSKDGSRNESFSLNQNTFTTIDGVECEQAVGFNRLPEGDWTFEIWTDGNSTEGNAVHVYIIERPDHGSTLLLGVGTVLLTIGLIMIFLVYDRRRRGR